MVKYLFDIALYHNRLLAAGMDYDVRAGKNDWPCPVLDRDIWFGMLNYEAYMLKNSFTHDL